MTESHAMSQTLKDFSSRAGKTISATLKDTLTTGWELVKIMVPVILLTKLLLELRVVGWIGGVLSPLMGLVGLPGSMGLVLASGMIVSPYAALVMYAELAGTSPLSAAQATVLGTMILMAHALLVELRIAQKAGMRIPAQLVLRVGGAFLLGWILQSVYTAGSWLQAPAAFLWRRSVAVDSSLLAWAFNEVKNLALIFLIILLMISMLRILRFLGVIGFLQRILSPLLAALGMGKDSAPITIIGITLGLGLGGGLIIQEARSGRMTHREVFFSLALMCIFHSLIEDTAVMMLLGAHLSGLLWGRLVFSLIIIFLMVRIVKGLPERLFERFFFRVAA